MLLFPEEIIIQVWCSFLKRISRFDLAVSRYAGKQKDLGSIPLRLSFLFENCGLYRHCLMTLSITVNETLKWLSSLAAVCVCPGGRASCLRACFRH